MTPIPQSPVSSVLVHKVEPAAFGKRIEEWSLERCICACLNNCQLETVSILWRDKSCQDVYWVVTHDTRLTGYEMVNMHYRYSTSIARVTTWQSVQVCMCMYVHVWMCVCVCVRRCIYVNVCHATVSCTGVYVCICVSVRVAYMYVCVCACKCGCLCAYVCMFICLCVLCVLRVFAHPEAKNIRRKWYHGIPHEFRKHNEIKRWNGPVSKASHKTLVQASQHHVICHLHIPAATFAMLVRTVHTTSAGTVQQIPDGID